MFRRRIKGFHPFLEGLAHSFDLFGILGSGFPDTKDDSLAKDLEAIARDWKIVGDDLRRAMERYAKQYGLPK